MRGTQNEPDVEEAPVAKFICPHGSGERCDCAREADALAAELEKWNRNVRAVLSITFPAELVVLVCEGGGPEEVLKSLAVSAAKLVQALTDARAKAADEARVHDGQVKTLAADFQRNQDQWQEHTKKLEKERAGAGAEVVTQRERADRAEQDLRTVRGALATTRKELEELDRAHRMYRHAWFRELGGWAVEKAHEIDGLVLGTKKLREAAKKGLEGLRADLEKQTAIAARVPELAKQLKAATAKVDFAAERVAEALDGMVAGRRVSPLVPVEHLRGLVREAIQADPPPDGAELLDKYRGEAERERFAAQALTRRREQLELIANALDEFGPQHLRDGRSLTVADCVMDAMGTLRAGIAQARAERGEAPALRVEVERLKKLIDRDRTGLASGLDEVRRLVGGFSWICDGTWGSYAHDEQTSETLRREVCSAFGAIRQQVEYSLRQSGWRADAAYRPEVEAKVDAPPPRVVPLWCPFCRVPHHDTGEWATRPHRSHRCDGCGAEWHIKPAVFGAPVASPNGDAA